MALGNVEGEVKLNKKQMVFKYIIDHARLIEDGYINPYSKYRIAKNLNLTLYIVQETVNYMYENNIAYKKDGKMYISMETVRSSNEHQQAADILKGGHTTYVSEENMIEDFDDYKKQIVSQNKVIVVGKTTDKDEIVLVSSDFYKSLLEVLANETKARQIAENKLNERLLY